MTLYIVATPIGNLEDVTFRAISTLKDADIILCEDTRVTKKLLDRYELKKQLISYHQHSNEKKILEILNLLKEGKKLALVTDAGTPGISDPGNELIGEILKSDIGGDVNIVPIPGPSAAIALASVSGFPMNEFSFLGFPPHKRKRNKFFKRVAESDIPVILYESSHRILKTLKELSEIVEADIVVGRELTKKFETIYRGTINEVLKQVEDDKVKGEFVIIVNKP